MGKKDRYNLEGAEDTLGEDEQQSSSSETQNPNEEESTAAGTAKGNTSSRDGPMENTKSDSVNNTTHAANQNDIPHRVRYDSPKDNRKAKTFYLDSEQDIVRIRELHTLADTEFDETVHQLDVYLAAFRSDLSDVSFLEEMRQIGYGYFE